MKRKLFPQITVAAMLTLMAGMLVLGACATNPYTQRSQLLLLPEAYDTNLGAQAYDQAKYAERG